MQRFVALIVWICVPAFLAAQPSVADAPDNAIVPENAPTAAFITCGAGTESYALYGHTALLIDRGRPDDLVFNFGIFSFNAPRFLWRFVLGEPLYMLGAQYATPFMMDYAAEGRSVDAQRLNLRPYEVERLDSLLRDNAQPDKREYSYNEFTDNCTTRALQMLGTLLADSLRYNQADAEALTYRNILHRHLTASPWLRFGQDLLLGYAADTLLTPAAARAFPLLAQEALRSAEVCRNGVWEPLVVEENRVVKPSATGNQTVWLSPMAVALMLLLIALYVSIRQLQGHRLAQRLFDATFFTLQTGAGLVAWFMLLCSAHPTMGSNFLVSVLNPLALVFLINALRHRTPKRLRCNRMLCALMLTGFIVGAFFQKYPPEIYVLALILLIRTCNLPFRTAR